MAPRRWRSRLVPQERAPFRRRRRGHDRDAAAEALDDARDGVVVLGLVQQLPGQRGHVAALEREAVAADDLAEHEDVVDLAPAAGHEPGGELRRMALGVVGLPERARAVAHGGDRLGHQRIELGADGVEPAAWARARLLLEPTRDVAQARHLQTPQRQTPVRTVNAKATAPDSRRRRRARARSPSPRRGRPGRAPHRRPPRARRSGRAACAPRSAAGRPRRPGGPP